MGCKNCGTNMSERLKINVPDGVAWYCLNSQCTKYKTTRSIRDGSFFARYRHSLRDIWTIVVSWLCDVSASMIRQLYAVEKKFILKIITRLREAVENSLQEHPITLGGRGIVCQVDESHLAFHSKYGVGRIPNRQQWVFGIVDTSYTPAKGYIELVPSRTREVLFGVIEGVCAPGTIIHSDCWAAYRQLQNHLGFEHHTVNHRHNFVDPLTGVHTQHVESYWNRVKSRIKEMKGLSRESLPKFVSEFVFKDYHRERALTVLVGLLSADNFQ